jgi:transposase
MTAAISTDLKEHIVRWYYDEQMTMEEVAKLAHVSVGLVSKVVSLHRTYNQVTNPCTLRNGRPSNLNLGDRKYLGAILEANPSLYLDEIQERLATNRNLHVSIATICRTLQHLELNRKLISKTASQRDEELRTLWEIEMAQYTDPDVFVFLDESAVDQSTAHRTRGRSEPGTRCVRRMTFIRGVRHSILPALTLDGIIGLDIFEGSINKDRFLLFIREQVVCTLLYTVY